MSYSDYYEKGYNRDDIRVLTDTVTVVGCNIIPVNIHAKITAISEDVIEMAKKQFIEKFESAKGLGWNVTKSWIIANLFIEGIENIKVIQPGKDIVVQGNECTTLGNVKVEGV